MSDELQTKKMDDLTNRVTKLENDIAAVITTANQAIEELRIRVKRLEEKVER